LNEALTAQLTKRVITVGKNSKLKLFVSAVALLLASGWSAYANTKELGKGTLAEKRECYDALTKGSMHEEWTSGSSGAAWADLYYLINGWIYFVRFNRKGFGGDKLFMLCEKWKLD
jgi:hypothetical protein